MYVNLCTKSEWSRGSLCIVESDSLAASVVAVAVVAQVDLSLVRHAHRARA